MEESAKTLDDWYGSLRTQGETPSDAVIEALSDDLNTPQMTPRCTACAQGRAGAERDRKSLLLRCGFSASCPKCGGLEGPKTASEVVSPRTNRWFDFQIAPPRVRERLQGIRSHPRRTRGDGVVIKDSKDGTTREIAR